MTRRITPQTSLDNLKKEAKRWLKELRSNIPEAKQRFVTGRPSHRIARHAAARILAQNPEIARANLYTAVVCGELEEVERQLRQQPQAAREKRPALASGRDSAGHTDDNFKDLGPKDWEPLLYLCFARLPMDKAAENAIAIARLLLRHGADPNAFFMAGHSRYTPLVGVIGEGEEDRPAHPHRDALVRLLLEHGAEPYDIQVIYNIHFHGQVLWYLELMYEFSTRAGRNADWKDPEWHMLDMGNYGSGARWHLSIAIQGNDLDLAKWCLEHGASPNAAPPRAESLPQQSFYEQAVRAGQSEMVELLVRHGAVRTTVTMEGVGAFVAACQRLDRDEAKRLLEQHPECLQSSKPILAAVKNDKTA